MTMTQQPTPQTQPTGLHPADHVRLAEQVKVAVLFVGKQTDVTLPASSPVAAVVDSLVRILQNRETEEDGGLRSPDDDRMVSPGLVTLTLIDGRPLDRTQSLAQQGVADGDLLILEITDAEVEFTPIVEAPSSAVAVLNAARYSAVTAETTRVFAGVTGAVTVLVVIGVLLLQWWRNLGAGQDWNLWPAAIAIGLGVALLVAGSLVWWRRGDAVIASSLWLPALVVFAAAAVMGTPGRPGTWHAMLAAALVATVAAVLWRLSAAPKGLLAWVTITATVLLVIAGVHSLGVSLFYVWVATLAAALFVLTNASAMAGMMAGIPVPPFPTVTGKDTFDDAEHIAQEALVAAQHNGTPSIKELTRAARAANTYLTALLASAAVFFVGGAFATVRPGEGRWWLATVYVVIIGTILVLRGRAFTSRAQAIIVVATGLTMFVAVAVRYAVGWHSTAMTYSVVAALLGLGLLALVIASAVPQRVFSPVFRKLVEWLEYLLVVLVPPLMVWLLNLFYLIRNH